MGIIILALILGIIVGLWLRSFSLAVRDGSDFDANWDKEDE